MKFLYLVSTLLTGVCDILRHKPCNIWCEQDSQTPILLKLVCVVISDTNLAITGVCGILRHQPCYI